MAVFTWRSPSKQGTATGPVTVNVTEPTGIALGDWEVALFTCDLAVTIATPAGWTLYGTAAGATGRFYVFILTGGRGSGVPTLAFVATGTGAIEWHTAAVGGTNLKINASANSTLGVRTNPDCPAAVATQSNVEAIAIGMNYAGSLSAWAITGGYTIRTVNTAALDCVISSRSLSVTGSEDPPAYTGGGGSQDTWEVTMLLEALVSSGAHISRPFPFRPGSPRSR